MSNSLTKKKRRIPPLLVGTWISGDEYGSSVAYVVIKNRSILKVRAVDHHDGEEADVFEIKWDGEVLSFATHWNSTGRFARCHLRLISQNRVELTYTYTDTELLDRK